MSGTTDFGSPTTFGMHHFYVEIPPAPRDVIRIYEDFGFDGDEARRETVACRLVLACELWTKIWDDARRDFNARLKSKVPEVGQREESNWIDFLVESCVSLAGLDDQSGRGWRKALYCALSDGTNIKLEPKIKSKTKQKNEINKRHCLFLSS